MSTVTAVQVQAAVADSHQIERGGTQLAALSEYVDSSPDAGGEDGTVQPHQVWIAVLPLGRSLLDSDVEVVMDDGEAAMVNVESSVHRLDRM